MSLREIFIQSNVLKTESDDSTGWTQNKSVHRVVWSQLHCSTVELLFNCGWFNWFSFVTLLLTSLIYLSSGSQLNQSFKGLTGSVSSSVFKTLAQSITCSVIWFYLLVGIAFLWHLFTRWICVNAVAGWCALYSKGKLYAELHKILSFVQD
jgi:hypothetical protein